MRSVREDLLHHFPLGDAPVREPDDDLADALYALLYSIDDDLSVDGWTYFQVIRESKEALEAVGLMSLLPSDSVPIEMKIKATEAGFDWSVQIARLDPAWLALSDSKRWNSVYLYATGERETPRWSWERRYHGSVPRNA